MTSDDVASRGSPNSRRKYTLTLLEASLVVSQAPLTKTPPPLEHTSKKQKVILPGLLQKSRSLSPESRDKDTKTSYIIPSGPNSCTKTKTAKLLKDPLRDIEIRYSKTPNPVLDININPCKTPSPILDINIDSRKALSPERLQNKNPAKPRSPNRESRIGYYFKSSSPCREGNVRSPKRLSPISDRKHRSSKTASPTRIRASTSPSSYSTCTRVRTSKSPSCDNFTNYSNRKVRQSRSPNPRAKSRRDEPISLDKNREYLERLLARNMHICYITNLRNYIKKLKTNYNCDPEYCPALQERLYKHRLQYHPELLQKCKEDCPNLQDGFTVNPSKIELDGMEAQTKITLANLGDLTISIETKPKSTNTSKNNLVEKSDDNKGWNEEYKTSVENVVRKWFTKIPFHPDDKKKNATLKEESIKHLIDKIRSDIKVSGEDYNYKLKNHIDECLEELSIWYPGSKRDQIAFKEGLREYLYDKIRDMNKDFFTHREFDATDNNLQNAGANEAGPGNKKGGTANVLRTESHLVNSNKMEGRDLNANSFVINSNKDCCGTPCAPECGANEIDVGKRTVSITFHKDGKASINFDSKGDDSCEQQCAPMSGVSSRPMCMSNDIVYNVENGNVMHVKSEGNRDSSYGPESQVHSKLVNKNNGNNAIPNSGASNINTSNGGKQNVNGSIADANGRKTHNSYDPSRLSQTNTPNAVNGQRPNTDVKRTSANSSYGPNRSSQIGAAGYNTNVPNSSGQNYGGQNYGGKNYEQNQNFSHGIVGANASPNGPNANSSYGPNRPSQIGAAGYNTNVPNSSGQNYGGQNYGGQSYEQNQNISHGIVGTNAGPSGPNANSSYGPNRPSQIGAAGYNTNVPNSSGQNYGGQNYEQNQNISHGIVGTNAGPNGPNASDPNRFGQINAEIHGQQYGPNNPNIQNYGPNGTNNRKDGPNDLNRQNYGPNDLIRQNYGPYDVNQQNYMSYDPNRQNHMLNGPYGPNNGANDPKTQNNMLNGPNGPNNGANDPNRQYGANDTNRQNYLANNQNQQNYLLNDPNRQNYRPNDPNGQNYAANDLNRHNYEQKNPKYGIITANNGSNMQGGPSNGTNKRPKQATSGLGKFGPANYELKKQIGASYDPSKPISNQMTSNYDSTYTKNQQRGSNNINHVNKNQGRNIKQEDRYLNNNPSRGNAENTGPGEHYNFREQEKLHNQNVPPQSNNIANNGSRSGYSPNRYKMKEKSEKDTKNSDEYDKYAIHSTFSGNLTTLDEKPNEEEFENDKRKNLHTKTWSSYSDPSAKCTIVSKDLCACKSEHDKPKKKKLPTCGPRRFDIEKEISEWLVNSSILKDDMVVTSKQVIDALFQHIDPYISQPYDTLNNAVLKTKVLAVFKKLGLCSYASGKAKIKLNKLAEELANRLIGIQSRLECSGGGSWKCRHTPFEAFEQITVGPNQISRVDLKHDLLQEVRECLVNTNLACDRDVAENITCLIIERLELIRRDVLDTVINDIQYILENTNELERRQVIDMTNCIIHNVRELITYISNINNRTDFNTTMSVRPAISGVLSIYTSEREISPFDNILFHKKKDSVLDLNSEEKDFKTKVSEVIKTWLQNVPNIFNLSEDYVMNEIITKDLAGEIVDHLKIKQLVPDPDIEYNSFMTVYVYKWLMKYRILEDLKDAEPYTQALVQNLEQMQFPAQSKPMHVSKQVVGNQNDDEVLIYETKPDVKDPLAKEIIMWMDRQPLDIYQNNEKAVLAQQAHDIAKKIKDKFDAKKSEKDITKSVKDSLKKIIKHAEKNKIDYLADSLMDKIKVLPQYKISVYKGADKSNKNSKSTLEDTDIDTTMRKFIAKYIEHNSETDDPLTKGAYAQLLKTELMKICPLNMSLPSEKFSAWKLDRDLTYVKDISDWLRKLPVDSCFNTLGNKDRIELIKNLTKCISDVEDESERRGCDSNTSLANVIGQFLHKLPILPDQLQNARLMVDSLVTKIVHRRNNMPLPRSYRSDENFPEIIEEYIRTHGQEVVEDELKLEAWSARLLDEITETINETEYRDVEDDVKVSVTLEDFNLKLDYAYQISDWVKNLPLAGPIQAFAVAKLARKMADHHGKKLTDKELNNYMNTWIKNLPLDPQKEIDVSFFTKQLMNRKLRVKADHNSKAKVNKRPNSPIKSKKLPKFKMHLNRENPGEIIVNAVVEWCNNLPLYGAPENEIKKVKGEIENNLFQKIAKLNDDPRCANNDELFKGALGDEVDDQLKSIPNNITIKDKHPLQTLKPKLLNRIQEARFYIKNIVAGDTYRQKLENALDTSFPNPVQDKKNHPGFDLYKTYLADMFILHNFDHGNDEAKLNYEKKIKYGIDKYAPYAQERNIIPLTKEQVYNELYGALFSVPVPDKDSLAEDVEEIKTKYEVESWFKKISSSVPTGDFEALERNQKLALLAKRLHQMDKEKDSKEKMFKEITKWLHKLTISGNVEQFSVDLIERLKITANSRKCVQPTDIRSYDSKIILKRPDDRSNLILYNQNEIYVNPNTTIGPLPAQQRQRPGDILIRIIDEWCDIIPLPPLTNEESQILKADLNTKVLMAISELNSDPRTFDEDIIYSHLLNEELDRILSAVPTTEKLTQNSDELKRQLISALQSIKHIIIEDKARYEYRKDLNTILDNLIYITKNPSNVQTAPFNKVKVDIINSFIEYKFNKHDEEGKQFYKNKILESLSSYFAKAIEDITKRRAESLLKGNQILVELSKIPPPNERALKEEVEEIRMKREIEDFFSKFSIKLHKEEDSSRNLLLNSLAKQLHDFEKFGYVVNNVQNMRNAVNRTLQKLGAEVDDSKVNGFLEKLRGNEMIRKAPAFKPNFDGFGDYQGEPVTSFQTPDQLAGKRYIYLNGQSFGIDATSSPIPGRSPYGPLLMSYQAENAREPWNAADDCAQPMEMTEANSGYQSKEIQARESSHLVVVLPHTSQPPTPSPINSTLESLADEIPRPEYVQAVIYPKLSTIKSADEMSNVPSSHRMSPVQLLSPKRSVTQAAVPITVQVEHQSLCPSYPGPPSYQYSILSSIPEIPLHNKSDPAEKTINSSGSFAESGIQNVGTFGRCSTNRYYLKSSALSPIQLEGTSTKVLVDKEVSVLQIDNCYCDKYSKVMGAIPLYNNQTSCVPLPIQWY